MRIAFCIDKQNGISFFNKRHSMDALLRQKLFELLGENQLYLNSYSANQFENKEKLIISEDFLSKAGSNDICFIEQGEIPVTIANELIVFNWNRVYPSDNYFNFDFSGFKRVLKQDFVGNSHKKITLSIYRREN